MPCGRQAEFEGAVTGRYRTASQAWAMQPDKPIDTRQYVGRRGIMRPPTFCAGASPGCCQADPMRYTTVCSHRANMCSLPIGRRVLRLSVLDTGWGSASARSVAAKMVDREHRRGLAWDSWRKAPRVQRLSGSSSPLPGLRRMAVETGSCVCAHSADARLSSEAARPRLKGAHPQCMDHCLARNSDA